MSGIRGFNDRTTVPLRSGKNAFHQPVDQSDLSQYMLPFRADTNRTNAMCMPAPTMNYIHDMKIWNDGRMDSWNTGREPGLGMSYFTREDLPYYYTLYDNFAVGDQYFQSSFTATNPNRLHFFSGTSGLSVDKRFFKEGRMAVLSNAESILGWDWTTRGEVLEEAKVSWKLYQEADNFNDNGFAWFRNFKVAKAGEPLFDKGLARVDSVLESFANDVKNDALPQVSWIIAPTAKSEHATAHPAEGEAWTAELLKSLASNPEVYKKTLFILNYDEGGQFVDHHWTPTAPLEQPADGVSTVTTEGEVNLHVMTLKPAPVGPAFRVPLLLISPWTRGNVVYSEAMDHTSIIKFLEVRFNVTNPNLSPWRRATMGDLTAAFDFENPDYSWPENLPDTTGYPDQANADCSKEPIVVPAEQSMPIQEPGVRKSRALPYEFEVADRNIDEGSFVFEISNVGQQGAPFILFDLLNLGGSIPKKYAVEAGKSITDSIRVTGSQYAFLLYGPNGFTREFSGTAAMDSSSLCASTVATLSVGYSKSTQEVVVTIDNSFAPSAVTYGIVDNAYGAAATVETVAAGTKVELKVDVSASGNWYDLTVGVVDPSVGVDLLKVSAFLSRTASEDGRPGPSTGSTSCHVRRFMGRMETGLDTISDPAMGKGLPGLWAPNNNVNDSNKNAHAPLLQGKKHPPLQDAYRFIERVKPEREQLLENKDENFVDKRSEL